jgi:hypothetical protein
MYYNSVSNQAKVCVGGSWAAVGVPTVTSLPSNPSDGDEVYYKVYVNGHLTGNTGYWHLRYNASTGYWDFLGGPALYSLDPNSRFTSTNVYSSTGSPYVYLPLNGDYDINYGDTLSQNQTNTFNEMSLCFQLTGGACSSAMFTISELAYGGSPLSQTFRLNGVTGAGGTSQYVRDLYSSPSNVNSGFANMFISATPVRVK